MNKIQIVFFFFCSFAILPILLLCDVIGQLEKTTDKYFIGRTTLGDKLSYNRLKTSTYSLRTKNYTATIGCKNNSKGIMASYCGITSLMVEGTKKGIFAPGAAGMVCDYVEWYDKPNKRQQSLELQTAKMELRQISQHTVELYQPPTTIWKIENSVRFTASSEKTIDITFGFVAHRNVRSVRKCVNFVFGNYINTPPNRNIYFIGFTKSNQHIRWLEATQPQNNSSVFWVRSLSPKIKSAAEHRKNGLYVKQQWEIEKRLKWKYPIFYGIVDEDIVLIYMIKDVRSRPYYYFDKSKNNPVWAIQLWECPLRKDVYNKFDIRIVMKKFISIENILSEYNKWLME